jgi:hypothetical protein
LNSLLSINKFWYEFDEFFSLKTHPMPLDMLEASRHEPMILQLWIFHRINHTYPEGFVNYILGNKILIDSINVIAKYHLSIMDKHFASNRELEQRAFEDFGQGILYDNTRPNNQKIHMMDESFGYHRWHAFIRGAVCVSGNADRWLEIDRYVGLAWTIQSSLKPKQDKKGEDPNNKSSAKLVKKLRSLWLSKNVEQIDDEFDTSELRKVFNYEYLQKTFNGSLDDLLKEHVLAKTIIGEADKAGSVLRLSGYIGKSKSNRIIRLYLNLNFDEYVEIPKDSIIYATTTPPGVLEFQGTYLWINRDTDITYTDASDNKLWNV